MKKHSIKRKKILQSWVILAALVLTGCGNSEASKEKTEVQNTTEAATAGTTTETATETATETEAVSDLTAAKAGSLIIFGQYEQDNDTSNGKEPIEWIVLEKREDGSLLVMSKYALDAQPYHFDRKSVSWVSCALREWLNSSFMNEAFSQSELEHISTDNPSNAEFISYGADVEDRVFLFSIYEAKGYFENGADANSAWGTCKPTAYAKAQGLWTFDGGGLDGNCRWWLRSLGDDTTNAAFVGVNGEVYELGRIVSRDDTAVRPALVIKP